MNLKPKRVGMFRISDELLATIGWEELGKLFGRVGMFVVRAEHRLDTRCLEYVAFCSMFDEVAEGSSIPEYRGEIEHVNHVLSLYFRRVS